MTWNIYERLRIIRVVEAVAAVDMSGALPWRDEWGTYFGGPVGLIAALRTHCAHWSPATPDPEGDDPGEVDVRIRRSVVGVLEILHRYDAGNASEPRLLRLADPRPLRRPHPHRRLRSGLSPRAPRSAPSPSSGGG